jgi:cytoskeletal protein CcmA (bactofilin family)
MWGRRKSRAARRAGRLGAFIDEGSEIEGKYRCAGTVLLDAKFTGEIVAKDAVIVGAVAVVHASVQAASLVVHGQLVGNVTASERVEIKAGARLTGDIEAPVVVMEPGAVHDGHCRMTKAEAAEAPLAMVVAVNA